MIKRHLHPVLLARAAQLPVVTVTGPRQSGKTTLCRQAFPDKPYTNLERPDTREFARSDPRGFLGQFPNGAVIDEIQRVPALTSSCIRAATRASMRINWNRRRPWGITSRPMCNVICVN